MQPLEHVSNFCSAINQQHCSPSHLKNSTNPNLKGAGQLACSLGECAGLGSKELASPD